MKIYLKLGKRKLLLLATVVCVIVAGSISALAIPNEQVFVTFNGQTLSGLCCSPWGDTIEVTEPAKVVPIVVTWSAEYEASGAFYVGLSVNGGTCTAYGGRSMESHWPSLEALRTESVQWVVKPADGLVPGKNTFTVCGGAAPSNPNSSLILGIRTLAAELGK